MGAPKAPGGEEPPGVRTFPEDRGLSALFQEQQQGQEYESRSSGNKAQGAATAGPSSRIRVAYGKIPAGHSSGGVLVVGGRESVGGDDHLQRHGLGRVRRSEEHPNDVLRATFHHGQGPMA